VAEAEAHDRAVEAHRRAVSVHEEHEAHGRQGRGDGD
jgi:hypothetical protein